jgi:hypothetical protein
MDEHCRDGMLEAELRVVVGSRRNPATAGIDDRRRMAGYAGQIPVSETGGE